LRPQRAGSAPAGGRTPGWARGRRLRVGFSICAFPAADLVSGLPPSA